MRLSLHALDPALRRRLLLGGLPLAILLAVLIWLQGQHDAKPVVEAIVGVGVGISAIYVIWHLDPAWTLSLGIFLSPIAGFWPYLHISGKLSPQRVLFIAVLLVIAARAPAMRGRPSPREHPVHWVLGLATLYAIGSAVASGTMFQKDSFFRLLESYGVLLFALYYVAPAVFSDRRQRRILIGTLAVLGAYLGLTALFETVHVNALVWPRYINDPTVGIQYGRARGPFAESVQNGVGLYVCGLAAAMGAVVFRRRAVKALCVLTVLLDFAGILFTLQRSVWLGAAVATLVVLVSFKDLRRYALPVLLAGAIVGGSAYAIVGSSAVQKRASDSSTVYDRYNLNRAALNMYDQRPLLGFGWSTFQSESVSGDFFQQNFNYPLSAAGYMVHNEFLSNLAELGLVGTTLWLGAMLFALYIALRSPALTREERLWKRMFLAYAIFYFVISSFVPADMFPNLMFWVLAGVVGHRALLGRRAPVVVPAARPGPALGGLARG